MSVFTSVFGEQYRGSNPNDPENLGGFQKGAFRDLVSFQDDFRLYGSLELGASDVPYTDRLLLNSNPTGVDILGLHFSNIEVPYLLAAFNDSRDALKTQQYILNPEKGYLNNPQRIRRDFLEDRFHAKCRRAMEFEKPGCRWCAEWKKFLLGEPADADILNDAYINWLGSTLRFTRQNDGTLQVETVTPTPITQSSAYLVNRSCLASSSLSSSFSMMFDSSGDRFPPCGVPSFVSSYPCGVMTPALRYLRISDSVSPSLMMLWTRLMSLSCGTLSKNFSKSISTIHS